jgi:iron complex transport system substrate-binding protein
MNTTHATSAPRRTRQRLALLGATVAVAGLTAVAPTGTVAHGATAKKTFPVTVSNAGAKVQIAKKPTRIVSLSPTATEMLFAIGAGKQVKAADEFSNYPKEAPTTKLSGFTPNVEAVAAYKPDLVIAQADGDAMKALRALKIPVLIYTAAVTIDESYAQIDQLGVVTGNAASAKKVSAKMRSDIARIEASIPKRSAPATYYHELDNTFFSVTSKTFIGQVYAKLGLRNIADEADKDGSGYPQLSPEYLVKADPDLVFLADTKCCQQDAKTFAARPGLGSLRSVKGGKVIALDDDVASRWGPRVVDFLSTVASALSA